MRGECYAPVSKNRGGSSGGAKQKYCNLADFFQRANGPFAAEQTFFGGGYIKVTYLTGKIEFKRLFHGPKWLRKLSLLAFFIVC